MSEMLALPMVSDCIKRGDNIDDCGVSRTITSMSRLGCTHPPDNARFWGRLQPGSMLLSETRQNYHSFLRPPRQWCVRDGSFTRVRHAVAIPSTFLRIIM